MRLTGCPKPGRGMFPPGSVVRLTAPQRSVRWWRHGRALVRLRVALGAVISGLAAGPSLGEERANGWLRQLRTTPLAPRAVVAAKIAVAMSFALPSIALVVAAAAVTDGTARYSRSRSSSSA